MNSLRTMADKVKKSPQIIRRKFRQYENKHQELREDCINDSTSLRDGISFYCKWLGTCQVPKAQGSGCTDSAVKQIIDEHGKKVRSSKNAADKKLQKVLLVITSKSLKVEDMITKELKLEVPIYRISYCTADLHFPKVFAFVARQQGSQSLNCHALLCSKESMAQAISLTVADAFSSGLDHYEPGQTTKPKLRENRSTPRENKIQTRGETRENKNETRENKSEMREKKSEMGENKCETRENKCGTCQEMKRETKTVSLLVLSQSFSGEKDDNYENTSTDNKNSNNPFSFHDNGKMDYTFNSNPFTQEQEHQKTIPNKRPLSEYTINGPHLKITGDEFLAAASNCGSSDRMTDALDLAGKVDDDFDDEFTRLAAGRSQSNLFETPVRRSDLLDDVSTLTANENTALAMINSKSLEDLLF